MFTFNLAEYSQQSLLCENCYRNVKKALFCLSADIRIREAQKLNDPTTIQLVNKSKDNLYS